MIDPRFTPYVLGLVLLAAIPTTTHSYLNLRADDRMRTAAIEVTLAGFASRATDRPADWILDRYGSTDWIERMYVVPGHGDIQLFVARSYDTKLVYHHPEQAIAVRSRTGDYATEFGSDGISRLSTLGGIEAHILRGRSGRGIGAYVLHYDGMFVADPYLLQARSALRLLASPRKAMTLFFVHDRGVDANALIEDTHVAVLLGAAVQSFFDQK